MAHRLPLADIQFIAEFATFCRGKARHVPAYSTSLDAAFRFIPNGWRLWSVDASMPNRFAVALRGPNERIPDPEADGVSLSVPGHASGISRHFALALTAAALRARAAK